MSLPWRVTPRGVELAVKVTPKAGRDALGGILVEVDGKGWLLVKVAAPAEGGKANEAVTALLAKALQLAPSGCSLLSGHASRRKRVLLRGEAEAITRGLRSLQEKAAGAASG